MLLPLFLPRISTELRCISAASMATTNTSIIDQGPMTSVI